MPDQGDSEPEFEQLPYKPGNPPAEFITPSAADQIIARVDIEKMITSLENDPKLRTRDVNIYKECRLEEKPLREIAENYGMGAERVRQITAKFDRILRRRFKDYRIEKSPDNSAEQQALLEQARQKLEDITETEQPASVPIAEIAEPQLVPSEPEQK